MLGTIWILNPPSLTIGSHLMTAHTASAKLIGSISNSLETEKERGNPGGADDHHAYDRVFRVSVVTFTI